MKAILIISILLSPVTTATLVEDEKPDYHRRFNTQELAEAFGVDQHDDVPKYSPTKVHGLQNLEDDTEHKLSLSAFGKDFKIKTSKNRDFVADTHTTEFVEDDGSIKKYVGVLGVYSFGMLEDDPMSHVALSHTGKGISGSIRTSSDLYMINPLPHRLKNEKDDHIIFRASDIPGDHIIKPPFNMEDLTSTLNTHRRNRRSIDKPKKTIELLIAADWKMLNFYGELVLPSYMLAVANVMAGFFRDASLNYPVDLVVVRSTIFKTNILQAKTVRHLLSQFSHWCNDNNNADENSEDHFDAALLFTKNGCADGCSIDGLAYSDVACSMAHSQGVGKDRGFMTAMTLSHELGHILNANHDGKDGCPNGVNIMASGGIGGGPQSFKWSECSSNSIEAVMRSGRSYCFDDIPPKKKTDSKFQLYGTIYNADKQCEYMLGTRYQKCGPYQHRCDVLFCNPKGANVCDTLYFPALHGTYCQQNKWCIDGACVPDGTVAAGPVHGGWSAWSEHTACNKLCNVGVQWKVRHCNNPEPARGGNWCNVKAVRKVPEYAHYRTCNTQKCKGTNHVKDRYVPDRNIQCNALKPGTSFCKFCRGIGPCELVCGSANGGVLQGYAKSGSYCYSDGSHPGVCVHGRCLEMGCDHNLKSGRNIDRCGVCNGDGSTCKPVKGSDLTKFKHNDKRGTFFITTIPVDATEVLVQEGGRTRNFLRCKIGNTWCYGVPTYGKTLHLNGATISYKLTNFPNQDKLYIRGRLKVPVHIYYSNYHYYGHSANIYWSYIIQGLTRSQHVEVQWVPDGWTACTRSCAGGWKSRDVICRRKDDGTPATIELCQDSTQAKPAESAQCNEQNCPGVWYISPWNKCSQSCGTGRRSRTITCSELTISGKYMEVAEANCPREKKPTSHTDENCNDISCPAHWKVLSPFTECSKTCEGGVATRRVGCRRLDRNNKLLNVTELECIGINKTAKPESSKICNKDISCPTWTAKYSKCSATCGAGIQQPNIVCRGGDSEDKVLPFESCDQGKKPKTSSFALKDCNQGECAGHKWGIKEGVCSTTCGDGKMQSVIYCYDIRTLREIESFKCPALEKPRLPEPTPCNPGICEDVYVWRNDKYGSCSTSCGGGVSKSRAYCIQLKTNNSASILACDAGTKPSPVAKPCNTELCPPFDWSIVFTECSVTCDKGVETGTARCKNITDQTHIVDDKKCNASTKPADTSRECQLSVCPDPNIFHWEVRNAGCNVTCGKGIITKEVVCYRKDDEITYTRVSPSYCAAKPEPSIEIEECVLDPCPPTHQWNKIRQYCSVGCGKGTNIVELNCTEITTGDLAESKSCSVMKIPKHNCDRNCKPIDDSECPDMYPIGCFADDLNNRKVPDYFASFRLSYNKSDPIPTIKKCYKGAKSKSSRTDQYTFFALQFAGECWVGKKSTLNTYDAAGVSNRCSARSGGQLTNYVYHIGSPIPIQTMNIIKHGCMVASDSAANSEVSPYALARIVSICGTQAHKHNVNYFGGDNAGNCLSKDTTYETIASASYSSACLPDIDGVVQYHIYEIVTSNKP